ncbi:MAG: phosphotransferase [Rhodospirillales bacterium]|nr:phosphotransferase [Rhodospirillales bacterium]
MTETSPRIDVIEAFLEEAGFGAAKIEWLPVDASYRRYGRLQSGSAHGQILLMDAPPGQEDVRPWVRVARHLRGLGLNAPEIIASDENAGLLIIEDFGSDTFTQLLNRGEDEAQLYDLAVDVLVALHGMGQDKTVPSWLEPYDDDRLLGEAALFIDWYLPAISGQAINDDQRTEYLELWRDVLGLARGMPQTLVLRDYHVDNLMRVGGQSGISACGLLDFQDALAGPGAYDFVSLIHDARRDISPEIIARASSRYFDGMGLSAPSDREEFMAASAMLSGGRNAKIIGIFTRLMMRDKKPAYLAHIPRVWRLLERDLAHPSMAALANWFNVNVPRDLRTTPKFLEQLK